MIARALLTARLALALGRVDRATYHEDGRRKETDTDHTVMLCLLVADLAQLPTLRDRVDLGKLLAFAIVHDVVEAYAGDTVSISLTAEERRAKAAREAEALTRLRAEFGPEAWIVQTIEAYERQDTLEARLVNYADKVVPKLTHALNGGRTMRDLGIDPDKASDQHVVQGGRLSDRSPDLPELSELFEEAHREAIRAFRLATAPTIEEVALALGEQHAHLAPYPTHVDDPEGGPDLVPAVWWAVHRWELDKYEQANPQPIRWTDEQGHEHALAGPTREDALVVAGEAIRAGRFAPVETCPGCGGSGSWETECCSGAGGCSCRGQVLDMGPCNVCGGTGQVQGEYDRRANLRTMEGAAFIGTGPTSGWEGAKRLGVRS